MASINTDNLRFAFSSHVLAEIISIGVPDAWVRSLDEQEALGRPVSLAFLKF